MSPNIKLAETVTPDGERLALYEHDGNFCIRVNGLQLMNSAAVSSELLLGEVAVENLRTLTTPCILIGGLGLGFTLKSVLEKVGRGATVKVAELIPEVVLWNRQFLSRLNGTLLDDPRVEVLVADVWNLIEQAGQNSYDAVLLDVDNGPQAMVQKLNSRLYHQRGLERIAVAIRSEGRAVFWSADPVAEFPARLVAAGFRTKAIPVRFCPSDQHCAGIIYVADKPGK